MKRRSLLGFMLIILSLSVIVWLQWQKARPIEATKISSTTVVGKANNKSVKEESTSATSQDRAPSNAAQNNLRDMAETLASYTKPGVGLSDLIAHLETTRQRPIVTRDANEFTGELHIVRTRKPLPGTRYFHAQYFTNDEGQAFVQHMSVEFKATPTGMNDTVVAVQKAFGLPSPPIVRDGYARWPLGEGHILWVKQLTEDDLQDDPFNAYSTDDIGTVRVAIEAEIH